MEIKPFSRGETVPCSICGRVSISPRYTLHALQFNELEGAPRICSACVYEQLSGKKIDFLEQFRAVIGVEK